MRPAWWMPCLLALCAASCLAAKAKSEDADSEAPEEEKTLSQQIADGKYGLIQKELYATAPDRPGILSYDGNPEVPKDTADTLGGLDSREIWLAENHVLVLRGGGFTTDNGGSRNRSAWPPIDAYQAPPRQVKIPPRPKVPPPFPVQLSDGAPAQFIGPNGTSLPLPPGFPGNGSYFAPPFLLPGDYPPPPGTNGSSFPPLPPYPPPANGSFFGPPFPPFPLPPSGNVSTGNGPYFPPPFPGLPYPPPPYNESLPPLFPHLPPGAAILPPPDNLTDLYDEDDPSIYYPPPYDFFYPRDNSTEVPPGPLVPGIILPPPPNFFAPLTDVPGGGTTSTTTTTATPPPSTETVTVPPTPTTVHKPPVTQGPSAPRRPAPIRPLRVEVTHGGQSPLRAPVVYEDNLVVPPREYDVRTVVFPTEIPVSYDVAPVTDILVRFKTQPPQPVKHQRHRKPHVPLHYYQLPRDPYASDGLLFQKPVYVLEYDSRQHAPTPKAVPLVATYFRDVDDRLPATPRPYVRASPTTKASFYFYEEPTTSKPRASPQYYQLPKQLTAEERYILQQISSGGYEYERPRPQSDYYWSSTSRPGQTTAGRDYNYVQSTPAPPPDSYYYQPEATVASQSSNYQTTPGPTSHTTPSGLLLHYTRQDQALIDDITKKYFTMFGQKLGAGESGGGPTTPLPPPPPRRPAPVSLHGDTLVNYRHPLPPVNPDSEFIQQGQQGDRGSLVSYQLPGSAGGHVYFLTPRLAHQEHQEQRQEPGYVYVTPSPDTQLRYRRDGEDHHRATDA